MEDKNVQDTTFIRRLCGHHAHDARCGGFMVRRTRVIGAGRSDLPAAMLDAAAVAAIR